jgi:hypothetical protein
MSVAARMSIVAVLEGERHRADGRPMFINQAMPAGKAFLRHLSLRR